MSIARHHAEWLSLLEIAGPFLSLPVLAEAFPQGLDAHDSGHTAQLRAAYEEWLDNQQGVRPDPAIHTAWIEWVLRETLEFEEVVLAHGQAIPAGLKASLPEQHATLRPTYVVLEPDSRQPHLLITTHPATQDLEKRIGADHSQDSPSTQLMTLLRAVQAPLGLATNGEQWLLVHAPHNETTSYVTWYAGLWLEEPLTLRAFRTLLGARRFFGVPPAQMLTALLQASVKDQHAVTDQLGYQVRQAVEILVRTLDRIDQDSNRALLAGLGMAPLYEAALTVMMRLVFMLCAEQRGLLLLGDPVYDQNYAVTTLRGQLRETADQLGEEVLERRFDAWPRLLAVFRAVYDGIWHEDLRLPAYGGRLFDPERFPFLEGRAGQMGTRAAGLRHGALPVDNRTVLHLIEALQLLQVETPGSGPKTTRTLSFKTLGIEQIGHVYEGLLDHHALRTAEPVLGLQGTRDKEPEIPLAQLEAAAAGDEAACLAWLREQTGRSTSALRKAWLEYEPDMLRAGRLRAACDNDAALYRRVLPWAGLVRDNDLGYPVVMPAGSVYVTQGTTRRQTGTHYTPTSLTEPIVQHTLEPLVYHGPAEGQPRERWELRPAAELLRLRVGDMAMGSGAFLVAACHYLAERLVEAWEAQPPAGPDWPADADERLLLAKRLVADRCLYGVDKNPLAVEMARLSLWLATMAKDRPFTFLDHALRHGDSLIGADAEMFERWSHRITTPAMSLFDMENRQLLEAARGLRRQLQGFEVRDVRDAAEKGRLLAAAEEKLARIKHGCDLLVGAKLLGLKARDEEILLAQAQMDFTAGREFGADEAQRAVAAARAHDAFHWPFEFPEVFEQGGFDGFVGNPPFIGGLRIRAALGEEYLQYLKNAWTHAPGVGDYCAYFFLRGYDKLRAGGNLGLIATNTIAQGDTLELGLEHIHELGGEIYHADRDYVWPGQAAVVVDVVHIHKGRFKGPRVLNAAHVANITPQLDDMAVYGKPYTLAANAGKSFIGSYILGMGFTMTPEEAAALIAANPRNADVLFPYLNGEDLNSRPDQSPSRWVINFFDWPLERAAPGRWAGADDRQRKQWLQTGQVPGDYPEPVAADYPDCLAIVREKVYPERKNNRDRQRREIWWRFTRPTVELYATIAPLKRVLVTSRVSKYISFTFVALQQVYSEATVVFAMEQYGMFAIMQSIFHRIWVRTYSSSLETRLRYTPVDAFESFPLPPTDKLDTVEQAGEACYKHRQQAMFSNLEGLTNTYNRVHDSADTDPAIIHLRELHVVMDQAVAAAYGWDDLDLGHGFHNTAQGTRFTISAAARREVLIRLLRLNHRRYAEEAAAGPLNKQPGKRGQNKASHSPADNPPAAPKQGTLFGE